MLYCLNPPFFFLRITSNLEMYLSWNVREFSVLFTKSISVELWLLASSGSTRSWRREMGDGTAG